MSAAVDQGSLPWGIDSDVGYLLDRLAQTRERLVAAVEGRRRGDPNPDDPFRGLYLSDEVVAWVAGREDLPSQLAHPASDVSAGGAVPGGAVEPRLLRLADDFGLSGVEVELLLVALLPEIDPRNEQLLGYLNDDVTRRRASVGLALQLCGQPLASGSARALLAASAPLVAGGLVLVEDTDRPYLGRALRVPDRVVAHLLGTDDPELVVTGLLGPEPPRLGLAASSRLATAITAGSRLVCVHDALGGPGRVLAAEALAGAGRRILAVDVRRLLAAPDRSVAITALLREARLTGAGLIVELPAVDAEGLPATLRELTRAPVPVLVVTRVTWDPGWSEQTPLFVAAPDLPSGARQDLWRRSLGEVEPRAVAASVPFVLSPDGIVRAAASAQQQAVFEDAAVSAEHVRRGARLQNAAGLERLARRIEPAVGWADLVLPPTLLDQLREIALRARHRDRVLGEWRMRPGGGRGRGVSALFAGDSGTGKTLSAEVIAADLGLDLYAVDLATVVDKYVGETEKNLERIFSEAAGVNGVLLFDEADAVFGKRSEVKDAHDRYANIESAYLLQRMESFDGLAILATNLRANLDEAFTRRLDLLVDFPNPDVAQRRALWDRCLGTALPRDDVDLDRLAEQFDVTGGSIRSIAVTAAYLAADSDERLTMPLLLAAVQREYRKLGRLVPSVAAGPSRPGR